jgi:hypothetical protein
MWAIGVVVTAFTAAIGGAIGLVFLLIGRLDAKMTRAIQTHIEDDQRMHSAIWEHANAQNASQHDHELKTAETYATKSDIAEIKEDMNRGLESIANRMDEGHKVVTQLLLQLVNGGH